MIVPPLLQLRGLNGVITILLVSSIFVAGSTVGGNAAVDDEPRIDFYDYGIQQSISDGELIEDDQSHEVSVGPVSLPDPDTVRLIESPALERFIEHGLVIPLLKFGFWVGDLGYGFGYWLANAVGGWAVTALGYLWQAVTLVAVGTTAVRQVTRIREVAV